jgi:hypothetical protein
MGGGEDFQSFKWIASVKRPKPGSQGAYEFTRERMVERIEMLKEALALERRIRGASSGSC